MGFWSKLGKIGSIAGAGALTAFTGGAASPLLMAALGAGGAAAGAAASSMAKNRGVKQDVALQTEQQRQSGEGAYLNALLNREQEKRMQAGDAWKRLLQTDYVSNYKPNGLALSPFSRPIQGPSAAMQASAADPALLSELRSRSNYSFDPYGGADPSGVRLSPDTQAQISKLGNAGIWEKILGVAGPALSAYSAYKSPKSTTAV